MGDIFKEQLVKRKQTTKDTAIRVCLVVLVVLIFFLAILTIGAFAIIITAAAGFGAAYLMSFFKVEYEYVFTNGELDIDIIYNKSRRKRLFSAHVSEIEIMAHIDDKIRAGEFTGFQEILDYSTGEITQDTYVFMINHKNKRAKVIISPNEKMQKAISTALGRRKFHPR